MCVDKATHKPQPLPDWWISKFRPLLTKNSTATLVTAIEKPKGIKKYVRAARCGHDDIDTYGHMNNSNYVRHCLEAACEAAKLGYFSELSGNIHCKHMKEMRQLYIDQWPLGDEVTIETWQSQTDPLTLHFDLSKGNGSIYQNSITFHKNSEIAKL